MTIAIIGAGMAGAACASELLAQGRHVVVFDKGRVPGGRMTSKRTGQGYIDLGAQYFTARSPSFTEQCLKWQTGAVIAPWQGRLAISDQTGLKASPDNTTRYIGLPSMHNPVKQLLQGCLVNSGCCIDAVQYDGSHWQLFSRQQRVGQFSQLILAIPQQQAAALLQPVILQYPALAQLFCSVALLPCWAVNVELAASTAAEFDGIFVKNNPAVTWLAHQASKTGRVNGRHWLVHFTADFSQQHFDTGSAQLTALAAQHLQAIFTTPITVLQSVCHRWRYAQQATDFPVIGCYYQAELALGLAGDWLNGGRIENAWLSGKQLAKVMR